MKVAVGFLPSGCEVASEPRVAPRWSTGASVNSLPPRTIRISLVADCFVDQSHKLFYASLHAQRKGSGIKKERLAQLGFASSKESFVGNGICQSEMQSQALVHGSSQAIGYDLTKELANLKLGQKEEKQQRKAWKRVLKARKATSELEEKKVKKSSSSSSSSSESSDCESCGDRQSVQTARVTDLIWRSEVGRAVGKGQDPLQDIGGTDLTERLPMGTSLTTRLLPSIDPKMRGEIEVCVGGKCRRAGSLAVFTCLQQSLAGNSGGVCARTCKCMGRCGTPVNVRVRNGESSEVEVCSHVEVQDVGLWLRHHFGGGGGGG
eukprot:c26450_g1_i1 orf=3-959(-)